jgi:hypothetical protein
VQQKSSVRDIPVSSHGVLGLARRMLARAGAVFPRSATIRHVVTRASVDAPPEEVWRRIVLYEDVPHPPPLLLRLLLPMPLRTSKPGLTVGALVQCNYSGGGRLVKRITEVQPPSLVRFEVIEQRLGIEPCLTTLAGAYEIRESSSGSEVALTTSYLGHLRPRWLWRHPERSLAHALHRHILRGMGARFRAPR